MDGLVPATQGANENTEETKGRIITILADCLFHETVPEGTEGAVVREYETSDGKKGEKNELQYARVDNVLITNVVFEMGNYGENLLITLSDGDNEVVLAQAVDSPFGEDLLKKLPAIDFAEKLSLVPYKYQNKKDKTRRGVDIYQKSDKVLNFFWDEATRTNLHGFPTLPEDTSNYTNDMWKLHFLQARIVTVQYAKEHIVPKFVGQEEKKSDFVYPESDIKPEDIPF